MQAQWVQSHLHHRAGLWGHCWNDIGIDPAGGALLGSELDAQAVGGLLTPDISGSVENDKVRVAGWQPRLLWRMPFWAANRQTTEEEVLVPGLVGVGGQHFNSWCDREADNVANKHIAEARREGEGDSPSATV